MELYIDFSVPPCNWWQQRLL